MVRNLKAIILAAGFGKRLKPLTLTVPKPLLMINSTNLLDKTINVLKKFGVSEIFINLHYLSEKIIFYLNKVLYPFVFLINSFKKVSLSSIFLDFNFPKFTP